MTKFNSVLIAAVSLAAVSTLTQPAAAIEYPWCAQYGGGDDAGGRNCGFATVEQCMATVRGMGGSCERNLFYADQLGKQAHPERKRRQRAD